MAKNTTHTDETTKNLDAAKKAEPLKKEVTGEDTETVDVSVNIRGTSLTFTCPASLEDAPADVAFHMEDDKPLRAFRTMLGEEDMNRMRAAGATVSDFTGFIEIWTEAVGLGK